MNKICTSLEQSKKLLELGIDRKTSDMYYWCGSNLRIGGYRAQDEELDTPAWSLGALMDLLPKGEDTVIDLCFGGYKGEEYIDEWFCSFEDNKEPFEFHSCNNKDKLDAAFEMVCWLKENGKL